MRRSIYISERIICFLWLLFIFWSGKTCVATKPDKSAHFGVTRTSGSEILFPLLPYQNEGSQPYPRNRSLFTKAFLYYDGQTPFPNKETRRCPEEHTLLRQYSPLRKHTCIERKKHQYKNIVTIREQMNHKSKVGLCNQTIITQNKAYTS